MLYRCLRFCREHPILPARSELDWAHDRVLLEVGDLQQRQSLESAARKNHWPSAELERRVRAFNAIDITSTAPTNGTRLSTHQPLVAQTTAVTINTTRPDKYDRYLADMFFTTASGDVFLNNALLENGHAVRKDEWEFSDWGV